MVERNELSWWCRVKREWHDHPLRNLLGLTSITLSTCGILLANWPTNDRSDPTEGAEDLAYAHIEAATFPSVESEKRARVALEWHNDGNVPIIMIDNDLKLFDAAGRALPETCCDAVDTTKERLRHEIAPKKVLMSRLDTAEPPVAAWACFVFQRLGNKQRYAIQKSWRIQENPRSLERFTTIIDNGAIGAVARASLICR